MRRWLRRVRPAVCRGTLLSPGPDCAGSTPPESGRVPAAGSSPAVLVGLTSPLHTG